LQLRLAEDLPRVLGDAVQLQQVVLNLVVNACQAMADVADGPRVLRIETAKPKPGSIEITVAEPAPVWPHRSSSACSSLSSRASPRGSAWGCPSIVPSSRRTGGTSWRRAIGTAVLTLRVTLPTARNGHVDLGGPSSLPGPEEVGRWSSSVPAADDA